MEVPYFTLHVRVWFTLREKSCYCYPLPTYDTPHPLTQTRSRTLQRAIYLAERSTNKINGDLRQKACNDRTTFG